MPIYDNNILTGVPEGYELVWSDDFEGTAVDTKKWCFKPHMCGQKDLNLYNDVKAVLEVNKKERHIRGGEATRSKYRNLKNRRVC